MAQNFDTKPYWNKLANHEPLSEAEIVALLKAVTAYQSATAYLADCNAATLESLQKSASKSSRSRFTKICEVSASVLDGHTHAISHPSYPEAAQARCLRALKEASS